MKSFYKLIIVGNTLPVLLGLILFCLTSCNDSDFLNVEKEKHVTVKVVTEDNNLIRKSKLKYYFYLYGNQEITIINGQTKLFLTKGTYYFESSVDSNFVKYYDFDTVTLKNGEYKTLEFRPLSNVCKIRLHFINSNDGPHRWMYVGLIPID